MLQTPIVGDVMAGNSSGGAIVRLGRDVRAVVVERRCERAVTLERGRHRIGVGMVAPLPEVGPSVRTQPLLGDAGVLEEQHVPGLLPLEHAGGGERVRVADRKRDQMVDPLRCERRNGPGECRAPVVTDDVRAIETQ